MQNNTFSIVIPTHDRGKKVRRAVESVFNQTYNKEFYEVIVIDDGSIDDTFNHMKQLQRPHTPLMYIRQVRQQRLIARNHGMRLSSKNWIVWMDDDDELLPDYLEEFNKAINERPDFSVFACGVDFHKIIEGKEKYLRTLKCPRLAKDRSDTGVRNPTQTWPHFTSGSITTGQFIFNREALKKVGYLIHTHTYGDFAVECCIPGYGWVPPQPPRFPKKRVQVLGNPWGEDFYMFYKLTRNYNVWPIEKSLYKKNCR